MGWFIRCSTRGIYYQKCDAEQQSQSQINTMGCSSGKRPEWLGIFGHLMWFQALLPPVGGRTLLYAVKKRPHILIPIL